MGVLKQIKHTFKLSKEKRWYETYWAFDVHGTILKPNYDINVKPVDEDFYPYAKEVLQMLTQMDHIRLIMWTCSYPHEIDDIQELFHKNDIYFDHIGSNPEISSDNGNFGYYKDKFYFNVMFEDKAGFDPEEFEEIYNYLKEFQAGDWKPDPSWSTKY